MELGIDIGRLRRIIHNGAPNSVSSFCSVSDARTAWNPPEMMLVFREEQQAPDLPLPQLIP